MSFKRKLPYLVSVMMYTQQTDSVVHFLHFLLLESKSLSIIFMRKRTRQEQRNHRVTDLPISFERAVFDSDAIHIVTVDSVYMTDGLVTIWRHGTNSNRFDLFHSQCTHKSKLFSGNLAVA